MRLGRFRWWVAAFTVVATVVVAFGWSRSTASASAPRGQAVAPAAIGDEAGPPDWALRPGGAADAAAFAAAAGPTTTLYFTPQDNVYNATVITLYNATNADKNVLVQAYFEATAPYTMATVTVPAWNLVHLVSDPLAAGSPPSWANAVVTNFTDGTAIARLIVPNGVRVDGYVVFDGAGVIDPNADQGAIPLRFVTKGP
jgi:hypothetical protein